MMFKNGENNISGDVFVALRKSTFLFWFFFSLPVFIRMWEKWRLDDYEYCLVVLVASLYLLFKSLREGKLKVSSPRMGMALLFFSLGMVSFWLGTAISFSFLLFVSVWFFLYACFFFVFGDTTRNVYFPLFLLLLSVPLPAFIERTLTFKLQLVTSTLSAKILKLLGIPVFRDGNILDLGFTKLQVAEACSGLRYVLPLLFLSIIVGFFRLKGRNKILKTAFLAVSVVPIVLVSNTLRIVLTALAEVNGYGYLTRGVWHEALGILVFLVALSMLLGEIYVLDRVVGFMLKIFERLKSNVRCCEVGSYQDAVASTLDGDAENDSKDPEENPGSMTQEDRNDVEGKTERRRTERCYWWEGLFALFFMVSFFSLGVFLLKDTLTEKQKTENVVLYFPSRIDGWIGIRQYFSPAILKSLKADAYVSYSFRNKQYDGVLHLLIVYYSDQSPGKTPHTPTSCMLGTGWSIKKRGVMSLVLGEKMLTFNYMILERRNMKTFSLYAFAVDGKLVTSQLKFRWYSLLTKLRKGRSPGMLLRIEYVTHRDVPVHEMRTAVEDFLMYAYKEFKRLLKLTKP